ncbi:TPR repeat protein [Trichormus variabilis ATCC 29413]|uniref:TPR repeat protein n=3 Tax=Anabaena variabilis TaxID=264691 RepID=Q3MG41_TRIV2|nr:MULTISPECIES: tetratricopeptide repeat protein [Nostocaceae]ABA20045.1 TPR repeat protein [Trichormus variabilis ATCC 29413]MBC1215981.1 tetratricopeptide repeat protein [Trichormus variabilis ARAD]MBC1268444.1 tetratricopeptide repeat protein [Trichormus variabilis FSR]MBC1304390.1 tetratricopeptide repeat protein [Trichormus variabilis N2B]MBC1310412.1 tetratricopeptide repeat protein [Trichormus variabilis PNB]
MYKHISFVLSVLLLGGGTATIPTIAQGQVLVVQANNAELKRLLEDGKRLVDAGDYNGAIAVYQQAATMEPRNARIHSGIGYLHAQQGNFQAALASYRRAIAINPNNSDFFYAVGYIKGNMGDTPGAKEAYRRAIQLNRNNVSAYVGLGITQSRMGDFQSANWAFEQAIKLDKNNAQTYEFMAAMYKQRRQTKQASNLLQKARDLYQRRNDADGVARVEAMLQQL